MDFIEFCNKEQWISLGVVAVFKGIIGLKADAFLIWSRDVSAYARKGELFAVRLGQVDSQLFHLGALCSSLASRPIRAGTKRQKVQLLNNLVCSVYLVTEDNFRQYKRKSNLEVFVTKDRTWS